MKVLLDIKEHKVEFVMDLLSNMSYVNVEVLEEEKEEQDGAESDDAPTVKYDNKMLLDATKGGASDLHFEPYEKSYRVRFRIDGVLQEASQPPLTARAKIAARIKILSQLNTTETRIPHDGRIRLRPRAGLTLRRTTKTTATVCGGCFTTP